MCVYEWTPNRKLIFIHVVSPYSAGGYCCLKPKILLLIIGADTASFCKDCLFYQEGTKGLGNTTEWLLLWVVIRILQPLYEQFKIHNFMELAIACEFFFYSFATFTCSLACFLVLLCLRALRLVALPLLFSVS